MTQPQTPAFEIVNYLKNKLENKITEYERTIKEKDETIQALVLLVQQLDLNAEKRPEGLDRELELAILRQRRRLQRHLTIVAPGV